MQSAYFVLLHPFDASRRTKVAAVGAPAKDGARSDGWLSLQTRQTTRGVFRSWT